MTISVTQLKITDAEHRQRCDHLLEYIQLRQLNGVALFDADYIRYYTGFAFIPTERPMAFVMNSQGERGLYVPRLELEHAQANALVERVDHYLEYPDIPHPMQGFAKMLKAMGIRSRIGVDSDGYPWILGYRGPALSELTGAAVVPIRGLVENQMAIKSPAELNCIRESIRWGNLAHTLLQRYTRPGESETEVSQRASQEATRAMLAAIGPIYRAQSMFGDGPSAGYRGQIGRNAAIPHALTANIIFQPGDVLVTGASCPVWGYQSELERTMIIGEPSDKQRRYFDHMVALQDLAVEAIRPGRVCADVDREVRAYFEKHDLKDHWKHHSGHCIGLRYHEGPFLDVGDDTPIAVGMVFTVEPGLYSEKVGGFRHSDTVVVTEEGIERMTYYPRDLESLTLPA
jgi:Xaa-Pro aminopeptidase